MPFNTFANRADPDEAAGSTPFACGYMIRYDSTLVDLKNNFSVLCKNVKVHSYNYSQWVELSMNIHEGNC